MYKFEEHIKRLNDELISNDNKLQSELKSLDDEISKLTYHSYFIGEYGVYQINKGSYFKNYLSLDNKVFAKYLVKLLNRLENDKGTRLSFSSKIVKNKKDKALVIKSNFLPVANWKYAFDEDFNEIGYSIIVNKYLWDSCINLEDLINNNSKSIYLPLIVELFKRLMDYKIKGISYNKFKIDDFIQHYLSMDKNSDFSNLDEALALRDDRKPYECEKSYAAFIKAVKMTEDKYLEEDLVTKKKEQELNESKVAISSLYEDINLGIKEDVVNYVNEFCSIDTHSFARLLAGYLSYKNIDRYVVQVVKYNNNEGYRVFKENDINKVLDDSQFVYINRNLNNTDKMAYSLIAKQNRDFCDFDGLVNLLRGVVNFTHLEDDSDLKYYDFRELLADDVEVQDVLKKKITSMFKI